MVRGACVVEVSDALAIGGDLEGGRKLGVRALRLLRLWRDKDEIADDESRRGTWRAAAQLSAHRSQQLSRLKGLLM
jgi:hypothetical protein